ncbi:very short patch repair endonuclease [Micromonospora sp. NPDC005252]|uniref:very short patch repair endonuclease n=1 Tax=Micromonospora sp. NPDC005252 TaxID=3364228 RepID=UPI00369D71D4
MSPNRSSRNLNPEMGADTLPTPPPSGATATMKANRSRDTKPELRIRRALFAQGLRYRVGLRVAMKGGSTRPDIIFTRKRVAVFVDGCYWHGCPHHCRMPSDPTGYWHQKIARNQIRDSLVTRSLETEGWSVIRIWEHTSIDDAVSIIRVALSKQQPTTS